MELLVGLKSKDLLSIISKSGADGIIFGSLYSFKYNYSFAELVDISNYCLENKLKRYLSIDTLISEDDLERVHGYLNQVSELNLDGIYFSDLVVYKYFKDRNIDIQLIYDPGNLNTNINDISFFVTQGVDCVIARELTIEEIIKMVKALPNKLDMQVFGHLRMSYSKRKFLTNYFKEINNDVTYLDSNDIRLVEESRNYQLPIKETIYGTCIYTDYCLTMYEELGYLKDYLKRAIIDFEFESDRMIVDVIRDIEHLSKNNGEFLDKKIKVDYPNVNFSDGYLYQKTVDKKEDE